MALATKIQGLSYGSKFLYLHAPATDSMSHTSVLLSCMTEVAQV